MKRLMEYDEDQLSHSLIIFTNGEIYSEYSIDDKMFTYKNVL